MAMTTVGYWRLIAICALAAIWMLFMLPIGHDDGTRNLRDETGSAPDQYVANPIPDNAVPPPAAAVDYSQPLVESTVTPPIAPQVAEPLPGIPELPVVPVEQMPEQRLLVTLAYFESETARKNLKYFVKHALHDHADFIFIFNGNNFDGESNATSLIPDLDNIRIVERDNTCFDLGATGEVLKQDDLWKQYNRFIVMNASLRGPFLPPWSDACWSDLFLDKVTETNKLVGITVNCGPRFHVQSMIWATDSVGMELLLDPEAGLEASADDGWGTAEDLVGLSGCYETMNKAIHAEIGGTSIILNAGYSVDVMMTSWHMLSPTDPKTYCASIPGNVQDTLRENDYFGFTIHPYETIFIKTNRNINPTEIAYLTNWMTSAKWSSWDKCHARLLTY